MNRDRCKDLSMFPTRNPISKRLIDPRKRNSTYDRLGMKCYDYGYDLVPCSKLSHVRNPMTRRCRSPSPARAGVGTARGRHPAGVPGRSRSRSPTARSNRTTSTAIIVRRMVVYVALKMAATTPTRSANITGHHLKRNTFHPPNPL